MSLIIIKQYKNRDVKVTLPNHSQLVSKEKTDNSTMLKASVILKLAALNTNSRRE